jgi:hypothetical protein
MGHVAQLKNARSRKDEGGSRGLWYLSLLRLLTTGGFTLGY